MNDDAAKSMIQIAREDGAAHTVPPVDLGVRVRELRKARGWTLEQAASQAGLARSTLSKIENAQMSPTYDALKNWLLGWKFPYRSCLRHLHRARSMAVWP